MYFHAPAKHGGHRALADILESIRELDYYRRAVFVADPGPTTEQVQAISAEVVEGFAAAPVSDCGRVAQSSAGCIRLVGCFIAAGMVVVAQLVERWLVEPDAAGSSPVDHPK